MALACACALESRAQSEIASERDSVGVTSATPINIEQGMTLPDVEMKRDYSKLGLPEKITPRSLSSMQPLGGFSALPPPSLYESSVVRVMPLGYYYQNPIEGGNIAGVSTRFDVAPWLNLDMHTYFSSAYFGYMQPDRIANASVQMQMNFMISDRISVIAYGQHSINKGIDPRYMPMIGNASYIGGEIRYKISNKAGISFGVQRSYYEGKGRTFFYGAPMMY